MEKKTFLEYWYVLYDRRWMIVIITISTMLTVLAFSKILPPVYEAKAVFFVPHTPDTATFIAPPGAAMSRSPYSPGVKEEENGPYLGILKSEELATLVQKDFPHKKVRNYMRKDVSFELSNEFMLNVFARDRNPKRAAGIANAFVKHFQQMMSDYSLKSQLDRQSTMEQQIAGNQRNLSKAKMAMKAFQQKNRTANLDEEIKQLIFMKTNFESQLERTKVEYDENKNKIFATKKKLRDELGIFKTSDLVITSPLLEKLRAQFVDLEATMASLRVEIKEVHPKYIVLKENYEDIKRNIRNEIENILKSQIKTPDTFYENLRRQLVTLYVDKERIEANINGTKRVLKEIEKRIHKIPGLQSQLDTLTEKVERYKKIIEILSINLEEVKSQIQRAPQVAIQVVQATPPPSPSFPILWLNIMVSCMAGFMGGIFYCFFMSYLEDTKDERVYRLVKAIEVTNG